MFPNIFYYGLILHSTNSLSSYSYHLILATDVEWDFGTNETKSEGAKKADFNTVGVANARRQCQERDAPAEKKISRRSASVGGASVLHCPSGNSAAKMSYQQLLSSATITYQEIYGGSRMYRSRPTYYVAANYQSALKY